MQLKINFWMKSISNQFVPIYDCDRDCNSDCKTEIVL